MTWQGDLLRTSHEFRKTFGESPRSYLLTRRLTRSSLLRMTDQPVTDICWSVGLQSLGSFTTSFSRTYGMSPTAYRATYPPAAIHSCAWCGASTDVRNTARFEKRVRRPFRSLFATPNATTATRRTVMKIGNAQVWVHDQDEAIAFYTEKLGMEVRADASLPEMGDFRWVTVLPGQDDVAIVLMAIPSPAIMSRRRPRHGSAT